MENKIVKQEFIKLYDELKKHKLFLKNKKESIKQLNDTMARGEGITDNMTSGMFLCLFLLDATKQDKHDFIIKNIPLGYGITVKALRNYVTKRTLFRKVFL